MPIISVRDNENNRSKKKNKTNKQRQKRTKGTGAIVKGWELNDFVVHLSKVFSKYVKFL